MSPPVFGITGWKNSGKTTLTERLIAEFAGRGYRVCAIKHAHESFDVDQPGRDSYRLREAGARRVLLSSPKRWALMHELSGDPEMPLDRLLGEAVGFDLVLIEGYKREPFPKIEIRRDGGASRQPLAGSAPQIVAIASDRPGEEGNGLPIFHLDDIGGMADFIAAHFVAQSGMTMKLAEDCFFHDKDRMPHDEALAVLKSRVRPVVDVESIDLRTAQGRYLAESVLAPRDIPAHDNTAVDGYAFSHSGYDRQAGSRLQIVGEAAAGHPYPSTPSSDDAVRIFTGAIMPEGLDTVVMQEDVRIEEQSGRTWVMIPPGLKRGANRRLAGEDAKLGAVLVETGARLRPQDVASAAACGLDRLLCYAPLKVAIFSTGDEIMRAGDPFVPGKVYDANAPMLEGLIEVAGAVPVDLGVLPDRADRVREALSEAARGYDVLVVSGGASQGAEDHVARTIDVIGKRHLWQIAIKPGRPMSFGQIGDCVVLGLPGNPVAVFVCFLIYVRPVLASLAGGTWAEPVRYPIAAAFAQSKKRGRREFWRAKLTLKDGRLAVEKFARDGSGLISSLREADGLIEVAEEVTEVRDGELVDFIPFTELGLEPRR